MNNKTRHDHEKLAGGINSVLRIGNTVHRPQGYWSSAVHDLLDHLKTHGFIHAPQFLGIDEQGNEVLSFIDGEVFNALTAHHSSSILISAAKLLREYHDASVAFAKTYQGSWQLKAKEPIEVICHGDYAPYNCVINANEVIGIIDFDTAHPGPRIWDVAYAVYRFAPLMHPENPDSFGSMIEQIERVKLFCLVYGLADSEKLISTLLLRLESLMQFMQEQALAGNAAYQNNIQLGHLALYQKDYHYIKENQDFFLKKLCC